MTYIKNFLLSDVAVLVAGYNGGGGSGGGCTCVVVQSDKKYPCCFGGGWTRRGGIFELRQVTTVLAALRSGAMV